ncbi:MAG: hypothetical protein H0W72_02850 [Planctomycetes bacterium]|nr:hypothetical protein [Planctomycetota bacterium]
MTFVAVTLGLPARRPLPGRHPLRGGTRWRLGMALVVSCLHLHAADAVPLSTAEPTSYSAPIVITAGGTYSGNWRSTSDTVPAVRIATSAAVVIEYAHLAGPGNLIGSDWGVTNLTVRHSSFHGKQPIDGSRARGRAIHAWGYRHLVVENNFFENTGTAIATDEYSGNGTATNTLIVRFNRVRNIDGRIANGGRAIQNFVAAGNYRQPAGNPRFAEIAWNEVVNEPGKSCSEDLINFFKAGGRSDSWFKVHDNYLHGSYPINAVSDDSSGSGVIIDGPDHTKAAYIEAYGNVVVNTTNAGMNVAAGSHIWFHHNRMISTGKTPDGQWMRGSFAATAVFDYYAGNPEVVGAMQDIRVVDNTIGWANPNYQRPYAGRNDWGSADPTGMLQNQNTHLPDAPITQAMQDQEIVQFQQRAQQAAVLIGPHTAGTAPPANTAPTISTIANRTTAQDTAVGPIPFTIGDAQTAAGSLTLSAASSDSALVPVSAIVFAGADANRTVSITPASGRSGSTTITITVSDGSLTATTSFVLTVTAPAPTGTGTILREWWTGVAGNTIAEIPVGSSPSGSAPATTFEAPSNWADNYATRMRGFVHPPVSGAYTFWIAGDDSCELWLSADANPAGKSRIASLPSWTNPREWAKFPEQRSATITLQAGVKYSIEALHKEGGGGDCLAVAWSGPSLAQQVIAGVYLSPATADGGGSGGSGGGGGALPSGWTSTDIGAVAVTGSVSHSAGAWTVAGSGAGIGGSSDAFRFTAQTLRGDGEITARVSSQGNTDAWAKAGVMIRESGSAQARFALMALTPGNGACFQRRLKTSGSTSLTSVSGAAPGWVRLTRVGKTFSAYRSTDGVSWQLVGTATISMLTDVSIGLAVTSSRDGQLSTVGFDNVRIIGTVVGNG